MKIRYFSGEESVNVIQSLLFVTVKVWDSKEWFLQMVFVGHTQSVTSLAVYPEGPAIMSSSKDKTVRVWNLDSCDEMDR